MTTFDRRTFLKSMAGAGAGAAFPESIRKALAIEPNVVNGSIQDVKHVVILMQENRSFDHYFGTLRGVRGFQDPRAVRLSNGNSVFEQPNQNAAGATQVPPTILPFRPVSSSLGSAFIGDLAHSWRDAHQAWNNGNNDQWIRAKSSKNTMAYLQRSDMPYYYLLADAFTICDNYFCSTMTSTDPNRYYMWSGWCGQNGSNNPDDPNTGSTPGNVTLATSGSNSGNGVAPLGPVVTNAEVGYNWLTYPERLQAAGVTWRIYQDSGVGLNAAGAWGWTGDKPYIGNYGDNALLYFLQYQNAAPGSPLYAGARTGTAIYNPNNNTYNNGTLFDQLKADVLNDTLPQVSWIVAPEAYSEHPNWPVNYGAWYVSNVLAALTANPALFASTVLIVNFDENDGFFDHVVAPTVPMSAAQGKSTVSTVNEIYPGTASSSFPAGPYGLGARVPAFVISPWSKGGWVCSEVFDHTSTIRFLEQRFGVTEPNITPWRRAVCGDMTSALDFSMPIFKTSPLPSTDSYAPPTADIDGEKTYPNFPVVLPTINALPAQEPGYKPSRALPYRLQANGFPNAANGTFMISFANSGTAGAWFQVRTQNGSVAGASTGPWGYTIGAGNSLSDIWTAQGSSGAYDLAVHGPNGFYRKFMGTLAASSAKLTIQPTYVGGGISLAISNVGPAATTVSVTDQYTGAVTEQALAPGAGFSPSFPLLASRSWYDLIIKTSTDSGYLAQFAGNVETGQHGTTDPYL
jgi:phospholipase C